MAATSHRERLYEIFSEPEGSVEERVERALRVGSEYLSLPIGFLTRVEDGTQRIVEAIGDHDAIRAGETCPLDEAYCRRTVELDRPLAVGAASAPDSGVGEAARERFGLGTYIGAKVTVDGDTYGTVCFGARAERGEPFAEAEEVFLELLARLVGSDIERRNHERELRERNERLRREKERFEAIAETSTDVLFRLDREARFTYVSAAVERVLGYDPESMLGEPFAAYMTAPSTSEASVGYERLLDGQDVESAEYVFLDSDGEKVVIEVNATPITDDGAVVGVQGVGRDITARKERQRELRLKTRAIDGAGIGISMADVTREDEPLTYVNEGFERLTGYAAAEAEGRNCRFLQGAATDDDAVDALREAIDNREPAAEELINYRKEGTPFWNRLRLEPVDDGTGDGVEHYLGFQSDITERKRDERLIQLLNRVLRHNLRNDMTVILGLTDQLDGAADPAAIRAQVRDIVQGLVDLSDRARQLERYASRDRDPQRLDPDAVLGAVVEGQRSSTPDATVTLSVDTDRGVCAGPELETAVAELVSNAVKHNPAGAPRVDVTAADDGEWIELAVADDGPGLDAVETAVIDDGAETPLRHSAGLGLWLVNWVVTRYGGSFAVDADDGGTTATIRLPAVGPDDDVGDVARAPTLLSQ